MTMINFYFFITGSLDMPKFFINAQGMQSVHASDCGCGVCQKDTTDWDAWLTDSDADDPEGRWPDLEEEVARAANCSVDVWQSLTPAEADKRLKNACNRRAKELKVHKPCFE